jgi:hypothetical protein
MTDRSPAPAGIARAALAPRASFTRQYPLMASQAEHSSGALLTVLAGSGNHQQKREPSGALRLMGRDRADAQVVESRPTVTPPAGGADPLGEIFNRRSWVGSRLGTKRDPTGFNYLAMSTTPGMISGTGARVDTISQ